MVHKVHTPIFIKHHLICIIKLCILIVFKYIKGLLIINFICDFFLVSLDSLKI